MRFILFAALFAFATDQISKWWVVHVMDLARIHSIDVLPPFLNFRMGWNTGINFGLFGADDALGKWVLILLALAIVVYVAIWTWRDRPGRLGQIGAGLLIGGALGNVVDRLVYGAVADFLNMSCCGIYNPFAFNVADVWIFVGAFGLIFFSAPQNSKKGA